MRKKLHAAAAATLLVLAAFTPNSRSNTNGSRAACTGSLSGAITGTYTCTPVTAVWAKANNVGALTINTSGGPALTIGIGFTGTPTVRTYTNADAGALSGVSVMSSTAVWLASAGNSPKQGSYSLKLSSVGAAVPSTRGNAYPVHGTLTAILAPVAGSTAKGNATVSITF
ncbi:MAG: hypothetical protein ABJB74_15915 [Gemmatimonas sp.]